MPTKNPTFNPINARRWMRANSERALDTFTDEIQAGALAEQCAQHFDVDGLNGPLDDPTHWLWDLAAEEAWGR